MPKILLIALILIVASSASAQARLLTGYGQANSGPFLTIPPADFEQDLNIREPTSQEQEEPVNLEADNLSYNDERETVTADGRAFLTTPERILRADAMAYDVKNDTVAAVGNVVLSEANGDIHLADQAVYSNRLQSGEIKNLRTTLNDGSRFTAQEGERVEGKKVIMQDATYTPCIPCEGEEDKAPTWGIRAGKVTHNTEESRIEYNNATFEFLGVPLAYTPYFSHADGSIKQKSGFLAPSFGYRSELGAFVESSFYWAIAPDQDATFGIMAMTEQSPLALAEYRKRWAHAYLNIEGGITYSDRTEREAGRRVAEDDEVRGHVFANAVWDMNDKWRSGINVNFTSDDQYMRQYDFTSEDVLENEIFAERFSGRDYASARLIAYQDIRLREVEDQPNVLPEIIANFKGEPGAVPFIQGQWFANSSFIGLTREGDDQDVFRASAELGWKRRMVSDYGLITNVNSTIRSDTFYVNDRSNVPLSSGRSRAGTETRYFPQAQIETSYPMARQFEKYQMTIAPVLSLTAAPNIIEDENIPNEDSQDVQLDASNLFEPSRFPGFDRLEDQSRITYGLRTGVFGFNNNFAEAFIGQSYKLDGSNNPFPAGSGLENQESDIVGSLAASIDETYALDYRFQYGARNLAAQRHEVDASADWNRFRINANYLFARTLEGTDLDANREQLKTNAQFYVAPEWRLRAGGTQDFGDDPGFRDTYAGIDYLGQCLFWSLTGEKNFTNDESGDSGTEIIFRIGLKNLGDFETSQYRKNSGSGKSKPVASCALKS